MSDPVRDALNEARLFLSLLPQDLGRGSLNGMRTQLQYKVDAALAAQPAEPVALTDDEIDVALMSEQAAIHALLHSDQITAKVFKDALRTIARAIERAHGIAPQGE